MPSRKFKRNLVVIAVMAILFAGMVTLVCFAPTLYRIFCAATGYGGTVNRTVAAENPADIKKDNRTYTVYFDSNVEPGLKWEFKPLQRKVTVHVGEPTKVYYYAKNNSDKTIVARAVYNVTPYKIAPYFFKIECFCFTDERLAPGEEAKMPLVFYVDKQIEKDKDAQDVGEITLSYTFFDQKHLSAEDMKAARDLGKGSIEKDKQLGKDVKKAFDNDAPRRQ